MAIDEFHVFHPEHGPRIVTGRLQGESTISRQIMSGMGANQLS
jgi:hypothetical protein